MERDDFLNIMAEWEYALKNYGHELPWQVLVYNCTQRQGITIKSIEKMENGFKLVTVEGELLITPASRWQIKLGRTAQKRTIFTHNLE